MYISRAESGIAKIEFRYNQLQLARVKNIPGRCYHEHPICSYWTAPIHGLKKAIINGTLSPGHLWPELLNIMPKNIFKKLSVEVKSDKLRVKGSYNLKTFINSLYDLCSYEYENGDESAIGSLIKIYRNKDYYVISFPPGLHQRITQYLQYFEFLSYIEHHDQLPPIPTLDLLLSGFNPRLYQQKACDMIVNGEIPNRATLVMATGAGKTILSAVIIAQLKLPTIFYTYSLELLEQTAKVFEQAMGVKVGKVGGRYFTIEPITVATVQTVYNCSSKKDKRSQKLLDYLKTVQIQFIDEGHMLGADTIYAVSNLAAAHYSYALTATPFREDGKEIFIEAATGPTTELISEEELMLGGYILPVEVEIYPIKHYPTKIKYYNKLYDKEIVDHWERTRSIVRAAKKYSDKQVIVLVREIFHGNKLAELLQAPFIHGSTPAKERAKALTDFKKLSINLLIASSILKQGVDIPEAEVLILAHGGTSTVDLIQRIGRVRRPAPGKKVGIIIDFYDEIQPEEKDDLFLAQSLKRIALYKSRGYKVKFVRKEMK